MPGSVFLFCAWILLAPAALSQQAPPDPAAVIDSLEKQTAPLTDAWLKSADPRMQAWGAYLALRDRRTEAIPALLAMVAAFPVDGQAATQPDMDRHDAMLAALDALIQLGVETPAADAQRIYAEFPVQSLILLSRSREDTASALLDIFKREQRWPAAWLAAGNLLLASHGKGFAAAVLEDMTVHAQVMVTEPGIGSGSEGEASCCGPVPPPKARVGWPTVGVYAFGDCAENLRVGDTVLAAGPDPASYRRQVSATYQIDAPGCGCGADRDLARQHYLASLLSDSAGQPPVSAHVSYTIVWQGPDAYRSELTAFIVEQQRAFSEVARLLGEQGLLSEEEAKSLRPKLQIRLWDQREPQEPALPAIATLAGNVTIEPF